MLKSAGKAGLTTWSNVMDIMIVGKKRKDGKYKVKTYFEGGQNMFGGRDHGQCYTGLKTPEKVFDLLNHPTLGTASNMVEFYANEGSNDV